MTCIPGNIFYKGVKIQLLDLPYVIVEVEVVVVSGAAVAIIVVLIVVVV